MDSQLDETGHAISIGKFEKDKKYKERILQQILTAICAMLNSNGGKVVIHIDTESSIPEEGFPFPSVSVVIRILEQNMTTIIGMQQTVSCIRFDKSVYSKIVILVEEASYLITMNYNLYLPSQSQVVQVPPLEPPEIVKKVILDRKPVTKAAQRGTHFNRFLKGNNCGFQDCKMIQFKHLKATPSKRTTLADRMTGKGNKFSCHVSAFANYSGGHIYYGITDEGVVKGEFIPNDKDKVEIIKKVEKAINKMIWPEQIGQPKQGKQWEIFFESVVDENSTPVPSTFVIVIYIASCLGGVFTEEPECYEMVNGKVSKMSLAAWKKGILQPVWLRRKEEIPSSVGRVSWSSDAARKDFTVGYEKLGQFICKGYWDAISKKSHILSKSQLPAMKLVVLCMQVTASIYRGKFSEASSLLGQYMTILPQVQDILIYEVLGLYLQATHKRASRDFKALKEYLTEALSKAELIEPGVITAAVYVFAATVADLVNLEEKAINSPDIFSIRALKHLQYVTEPSDMLADMRRKAHMNLATFYLGSDIRGQLVKDNIDILNFSKAETSIAAVYEAVCTGNPLKAYQDAQFSLVLSINNYRHSQANSNTRTHFLRIAFNHAKKAEYLAKDHQFSELVEWSQAYKALCTEELVREKLIELELRFTVCERNLLFK